MVPVPAGRTFDHTGKAETSEVVGHLGRGIWTTEERGDAGSKVAVTEAGGYMREAAERLSEGLAARIAEPQRRDPHAPELKRTL